MALVTIRRSPSVQAPRKSDEAEISNDNSEGDVGSNVSKSLNECYFANKGAAVVLGGEAGCERLSPARQVQAQPDIQAHLQAMFYLLRPEETLKMAVKLESAHPGRTRYLVVVCRDDEAALLGIDCNDCTTVGLVLRVLADTSIKLDGDGGFSVCVCNRQHIFKPVSVQAMWSALQTLHRASARARELNHFAGGASHAWCAYYEAHVHSDRSCLNEWHAMDCIESRRPPSPNSLRLKPRQRDETERVIRCTLKEIMMSVDLDEVTSKAIRTRLEDDLDMDLAEYKSFIDHEMLTILGQMDAPTEIFDHVYLGSEWNASNLEELQRNGVRHILNVTREIDNFFPGMFDYLNIRVYDDEKTDLLKHWDNTYKYISKARSEGSKVLVHCKMGISRSASVVIAYAMKAYNWNFDKALKHVKTKRNCIKPNTNFLNQLETYQGILDAMKNKEKLQRSKSETNLKSPKAGGKAACKASSPSPAAGQRRRPRSWAPDARQAALAPPTSLSLEHLAAPGRHRLMPCAAGCYSVSPNQIIRLRGEAASVRSRVRRLETRARRVSPPPEPPAPPPPDLAANERKFNETCALLRELAGAERVERRGASTWSGRLAGGGARGALRRRRPCASQPDLPRAAAPGLVSNLKREFEARSEPDAARRAARSARPARAPAPPAPPAPPAARPPPAPTVLALAPLDYPDVVVSTVMSKAQNKKQLQHGKTHPLTRLNLNRSNNRCSNPVYNTM